MPSHPSSQVWLVKLEGVESPEEAAELRGHTLLIPASAREPLEDEDEFYVQVGAGSNVGADGVGTWEGQGWHCRMWRGCKCRFKGSTLGLY